MKILSKEEAAKYESQDPQGSQMSIPEMRPFQPTKEQSSGVEILSSDEGLAQERKLLDERYNYAMNSLMARSDINEVDRMQHMASLKEAYERQFDNSIKQHDPAMDISGGFGTAGELLGLGADAPLIDPAEIIAYPVSGAVQSIFDAGFKIADKSFIKSIGKQFMKELAATTATDFTVGSSMTAASQKMGQKDLPGWVRIPTLLTIALAGGSFMQMSSEQAIGDLTGQINKTLRRVGKPEIKVSDVKRAAKKTEDSLKEVFALKKAERELTQGQKVPRINRAAKLTQDIKEGEDIAAKDALKLQKVKSESKARAAKLAEKKAQGAKDLAQKLSEKKEPIWDVKHKPNNPADLETIKDAAVEAGFPDFMRTTESAEPFVESGSLTKKMIEKLKDKGFDGIDDGNFSAKFSEGKKPKEQDSTEILRVARKHAGHNAVFGLAGGTYAGLETDDDGNVIGFNPGKAFLGLMAGTAVAAAGLNFGFIRRAKIGKLDELEKGALHSFVKNEKAGMDPEVNALVTHLFRGPNSGEILHHSLNIDSSLKFPLSKIKAGNTYTLGELLSHPTLDRHFPDILRETSVSFDSNIDANGYFQKCLNEDFYGRIVINTRQLKSEEKFLGTLNHEAQHAISLYEGLDVGIPPSQAKNLTKEGLNLLARSRKGLPLTPGEAEKVQYLNDIIGKLDKRTQKEYNEVLKNPESPRAKVFSSALANTLYWDSYGEKLARAADKPAYEEFLSLTKLVKGGLSDINFNRAYSAYPEMDSKYLKVLDNTINDSLKERGAKPGFLKQWEDFSNGQIIDPFKSWVNSKIYGKQVRGLLGIDLPEEYRELVKTYDNQCNRYLDKAQDLAGQLVKLAPTKVEQKRLVQVLRGGVTTNKDLASKALEAQDVIKRLRDVSLNLGLREYDMYDALTKKERSDLTLILRHSNNPKELLKAHQMLQNHYTAGSSYEFLPAFMQSEEGLTQSVRKEVKKLLQRTKIDAEATKKEYGGEVAPHLREQIMELENLLARNKTGTFDTKRKQITQGIKVVAPVEASNMLHKVDDYIKSGSFSVARTVSEQAVNIQRMAFLKAIADNPSWALSKDMDPDLVPMHYRQLKGKKYGPLNGMYVDKDIAQDIDDVGKATNAFIRNWDKGLGVWKYFKTVLSPATHAANYVSNVILAYLGGVNPADMKTYSQAAEAMMSRMKNPWFREAEEWGLMNNTFSAAELSQFRKTLDSFREFPDKITAGYKAKETIKNLMKKPAQLYENSEQLFKMAVFIKARKNGATINEAAKRAEEYLFNYRDIPPIVKHFKRWASPFFTFTYKASGLFAKETIRHTHKLALMGAAFAAWQHYAKAYTNTSDKDVARDRSIPGIDTFSLLLPWKDDEGNRQYWDITRLAPMGQYTDTWGQTGLPLGSFAPTANPVTKFLYEIALNRDMFTGQDIVNKYDGITTIAGKYLARAWKEATPSLAPGNYGFNNLYKGVRSLDHNMTDWTGQNITLRDEILKTILAIKVKPATEQAFTRSFRGEMMGIKDGIGREINKVKNQHQRGEINDKDYEKQVDKLLKHKQFLEEDLLKILQ